MALDRPGNQASSSKALKSEQKLHTGPLSNRKVPTWLITGVCLFTLLATAFAVTSYQKIHRQQAALASLALEDLRDQLFSVVRGLTLSSVSEQQKRDLRSIQKRLISAHEPFLGLPSYPSLDKLTDALGFLLLEDNPQSAIATLEAIEHSSANAATETITLALLGVAHYGANTKEHGRQSYTPVAEQYFERAEQQPMKIGLASNGLAIQNALLGFQQLAQGKQKLALESLRKAERKFSQASEIDGTPVAAYRYFNNVTYIRERLLAVYLDGNLQESLLLIHYNEPSVESFIATMEHGLSRANQLAGAGSAAQDKAAAECYSIAGEYYASKKQQKEASRRYELSKSKYLDAIDKGLVHSQTPEEIEQALQKGRLLRGMMTVRGTLAELVARATRTSGEQ